jgi:hypothetical protein
MPVGEPDGRATPRLERIVREFRTAGINTKAEPRIDAWLKTHAAFVVPLGRAGTPRADPSRRASRGRQREGGGRPPPLDGYPLTGFRPAADALAPAFAAR